MNRKQQKFLEEILVRKMKEQGAVFLGEVPEGTVVQPWDVSLGAPESGMKPFKLVRKDQAQRAPYLVCQVQYEGGTPYRVSGMTTQTTVKVVQDPGW